MSTHRDCNSLTGNRLAFVISIWRTYFTYLQTSHRYTSKQIDLLYSVLRQRRTIRWSVSRSVLQSLVSPLVLSRLDYVNSTLAGVLSHLLSWLQSVMNAAARLVFSSSKLPAHPLVRQLHWHWLQSRLHSNNQFLCTSVYMGPHMHTLLTSFVRWQMLGLVSDSVAVHLHHWLSEALDSILLLTGILPVAAACVWNSLPDLVTSAPSIAVFRSQLKLTCWTKFLPFPLWLYSASAVTVVASDTIIVLAYLLANDSIKYLAPNF